MTPDLISDSPFDYQVSTKQVKQRICHFITVTWGVVTGTG